MPEPVKDYVRQNGGKCSFADLDKMFGRDQIWQELAIGYIEFSLDRDFILAEQ